MIDGTKLFQDAEVISLREFGVEFSTFTVSAKRLETYPRYRVTEEAEAYDAYQAGAAVDVLFNKGWHDLLRTAEARNAKIERIRILPQRMNAYVQFEIEHGYAVSAQFGEEISVVEYDRFRDIAGELGATPDFWLFDDQRAYLMVYDADGVFLGVLKLGDAAASDLLSLYVAVSKVAHDLDWAFGKYVRSRAH